MNRERIQSLIDNLKEGLDVEVKNWLDGISENASRSKLARELIALANNGGGYLFIGFDDDSLAELPPKEGELEAFTQDEVASILQKYAEPTFQCEVDLFQKTGSEIKHPVIAVPGNHRTPVYAKKGSPDQNLLISGQVYVRRPGGNSEAARTQDDWEKLLDRLVKARQDELIEAIRAVLNSTTAVQIKKPSLEEWHQQSYNEWKRVVDVLPKNSPKRFDAGHWAISFEISDFTNPTLADLKTFLERERPVYTGWPVFIYLLVDELSPNANGNVIQAWLGGANDTNAMVSDFWRVDRSGHGFLLRPMQEDEPDFVQSAAPRAVGSFFDWALPVLRVAEVLKFVEAIGLRFASYDAKFSLLVKYYGTKGRRLYNRDWDWHLSSRSFTNMEEIESAITDNISAIRTNLPELVYQMLRPVFEQFQFAELPRAYVQTKVNNLLNRR